jgi:hypothetical protein
MAAFTVIDHTEIGAGGAASWEVTGIPTTYDHLLLKVSARSERATVTRESVILSVNGSSSTTNWPFTILRILSGAVNSTRGGTGYVGWGGYINIPAAGATADTFGVMDIWIPNYSNTANYKQLLWQSVSENASTTNNEYAVEMAAALYTEDTTAIDEIKMVGFTAATDIAQYSTFTLYGVTGA